jgi:inorganic pyrophosphatase
MREPRLARIIRTRFGATSGDRGRRDPPRAGATSTSTTRSCGGIKFDRLLMSAAAYPADYGYIPDTLGQDGDVLDAMVCLSEPTFPGCLIPVKPVGLFKMKD